MIKRKTKEKIETHIPLRINQGLIIQTQLGGFGNRIVHPHLSLRVRRTSKHLNDLEFYNEINRVVLYTNMLNSTYIYPHDFSNSLQDFLLTQKLTVLFQYCENLRRLKCLERQKYEIYDYLCLFIRTNLVFITNWEFINGNYGAETRFEHLNHLNYLTQKINFLSANASIPVNVSISSILGLQTDPTLINTRISSVPSVFFKSSTSEMQTKTSNAELQRSQLEISPLRILKNHIRHIETHPSTHCFRDFRDKLITQLRNYPVQEKQQFFEQLVDYTNTIQNPNRAIIKILKELIRCVERCKNPLPSIVAEKFNELQNIYSRSDATPRQAIKLALLEDLSNRIHQYPEHRYSEIIQKMHADSEKMEATLENKSFFCFRQRRFFNLINTLNEADLSSGVQQNMTQHRDMRHQQRR